jgi:hypothetical protein
MATLELRWRHGLRQVCEAGEIPMPDEELLRSLQKGAQTSCTTAARGCSICVYGEDGFGIPVRRIFMTIGKQWVLLVPTIVVAVTAFVAWPQMSNGGRSGSNSERSNQRECPRGRWARPGVD